jgi:hypothetical protein
MHLLTLFGVALVVTAAWNTTAYLIKRHRARVGRLPRKW